MTCAIKLTSMQSVCRAYAPIFRESKNLRPLMHLRVQSEHIMCCKADLKRDSRTASTMRSSARARLWPMQLRGPFTKGFQLAANARLLPLAVASERSAQDAASQSCEGKAGGGGGGERRKGFATQAWSSR